MYRLLVLDVDGTLTDGKIYLTQHGEECKAFHVRDGYGIRHILPKLQIEPAVLTGRKSEIVSRRAGELGIRIVCQGVSDKASCLRRILEGKGYTAKETVYIGDDENDLECMRLAGFSACPADAHPSIRNAADYIALKNGGDGAVREVIDRLRIEAEGSRPTEGKGLCGS